MIIFLFFTIITGAIGIAQNEGEATFNTKFIQKKADQGIDFYALGNEPFWSLNMDFDKEFQFNNLDGLSIVVPPAVGVKAMDADVTRYRSLNDTYELIIQIHRENCSDTMSDNKFDYKVTVDYKKRTDNEYRSLNGCGNFVPDFRLHNIWAIETVEVKNLEEIDFMKGQPVIEINMVENRISGHDGCNNIMGGLRYETGYIIIGNLAGTMMACPNLDISNEISKTLSNKKIGYEFRDGKLYFNYLGETTMILQNID